MKKLVLYFIVIVADAIFPDIGTGAQAAALPAAALFGADMLMKLLAPQAPGASGAPGGGIDMEPMLNQGPTGSRIQEQIQKANQPAVVPGSTGSMTNVTKGFEMTPSTPLNEADIPGKKSSLDDKLQMAALAAQLGSVLQGGKPPPPPSAPRGGGMTFRPYSPRDLYGG